MQGSLQGKALLVNASNHLVTASLNQDLITLSSMTFTADPNTQKTGGTSNFDTSYVGYTSGSNVFGRLGADNVLQLIGEQYSSTGSPRFDIHIDQNRLPTMTSTIYLYIFYKTVVGTDASGLRDGITITPKNSSAKLLAAQF